MCAEVCELAAKAQLEPQAQASGVSILQDLGLQAACFAWLVQEQLQPLALNVLLT